MSQLVLTPAGTLSVFGFKTPVPYPFGVERTGYLVTDLDAAVQAAQADGADVLVSAVQRSHRQGRRDSMARRREHAALLAHDAAIVPGAQNDSGEPRLRFPGPGKRIRSQLSRRFRTARLFPTMRTRRESRSGAPPIPTGASGSLRSSARWPCSSPTGILPYPYGREMTGYEVANLAETLAKPRPRVCQSWLGPISADERSSAIVQFPGGYIAEIHSASAEK